MRGDGEARRWDWRPAGVGGAEGRGVLRNGGEKEKLNVYGKVGLGSCVRLPLCEGIGNEGNRSFGRGRGFGGRPRWLGDDGGGADAFRAGRDRASRFLGITSGGDLLRPRLGRDLPARIGRAATSGGHAGRRDDPSL